MLERTQPFPFFTSSVNATTIPARQQSGHKTETQTERESGREGAREGERERDEDCCNGVRECKRGRQEREREREGHVTRADQSSLSALRIGVLSFNLQGIISTGWKLHVRLYRKQEFFYKPPFL